MNRKRWAVTQEAYYRDFREFLREIENEYDIDEDLWEEFQEFMDAKYNEPDDWDYLRASPHEQAKELRDDW